MPGDEDGPGIIMSRLEDLLREVVPPKGTQYKEGHLKVITDWMSARDDFAEKLKRTVVRKCMADGECREQAMYVAIGCGNPLLEDIVLEEMRKW